MSTDRETAIERLRKLLNRTVANGCTENEAMIAAAKVAELSAELGLRDGELEFTSESVSIDTGWGSHRARLRAVIAACTNTAPIDLGNRFEYVGRDPGPQVAAYLHQVCDRAINRALREFRATTWYKRRRTLKAKRAATADFTVAMVRRLEHKLLDLFEASISDDEYALAVAERDARYPKAVSGIAPPEHEERYLDAWAAGSAAGRGVELSHGVAGTPAQALLERAR